jgi:hypothetical protein
MPKYAHYQTVSVGLLLFRFNRNIKTLCLCIEAKHAPETNCFKTNRNNHKFSLKYTKICSPSNYFCCSSVCFCLIETPKLSTVFRYGLEAKFVRQLGIPSVKNIRCFQHASHYSDDVLLMNFLRKCSNNEIPEIRRVWPS